PNSTNLIQKLEAPEQTLIYRAMLIDNTVPVNFKLNDQNQDLRNSSNDINNVYGKYENMQNKYSSYKPYVEINFLNGNNIELPGMQNNYSISLNYNTIKNAIGTTDISFGGQIGYKSFNTDYNAIDDR